MKTFKFNHINFLVKSQRIPARSNITKKGLTIMYSKILGGCFSVYTKEVIEKVGGMNPKFRGYGHGHCEHTLRISRVKLTSPWNSFVHLVDAETYIEHIGKAPATSIDELKKQRDGNHKILAESIKNKKMVYIPL